MDGIDEELAFLLRSDNRTALLRTLEETGPLDRYELEERIDASRRTITRILGALSDRGFLCNRGDEYATTAFGSALTRAYGEYRRRAELADRYRPLLCHLDAERLAIDPELLEGATLTVATETSPYALLDRVLELRTAATRIREMAPAVEAKSIGQLAERIESDEPLDFEVILPEAAIEEAGSHPEYAEAHRAARNAEDVELYAYPESFSFMLGVMDGTGVLVAGVAERPHALVESDRPAFVDWIRDRLEEYGAEAEPLDPDP
jgi:predicted transcriptional regulator